MNHIETPSTDFAPDDEGLALGDIAKGRRLTCDDRQFHAGFVLGRTVSGDA